MFLAKRMSQFVLVVLLASSIVFVALQVATDPVNTILPPGASESAREALRGELGLDRPVIVQYASFLRGAVSGDLGNSIWLRRAAMPATLERVPATLALALPATLVGLVVGGTLGLIAGFRPGSLLDNFVNFFTYLSMSIAEFWLGIILILLLAVQMGLLPTGGYAIDARYMLMPVLVLAVRPLAHTAQMMRSSIIREGGAQYVMTARAKGASGLRVGVGHMLRNAAIPVLTLGIYDLSRLFGGAAVAIEVVFAWPGIGRLAVGALERGDVFLVQSIVLVAAVVVAGLNLIGDLLNFWLDPRTRVVVKED